MKEILKIISSLPYSLPGQPAPQQYVIAAQQDLKYNNLPSIPSEFIELLHHVNSLNYDGAFIFGINPENYFLDILSENLLLQFPQKQKILVLGYNEFEYLAYQEAIQQYQIIDKDSLEVVETYPNLTMALKYFLKAENE